MPKVGMEELRRRQLIAATIVAIHEDGYQHATLARISRRAGLSPGIVAHYFTDKAGLMEATMRHLVEELRQDIVARLRAAATPEARLCALIDANFSNEQCAPGVATAWLAFWGQVRQSPRLARLQRIYQKRLTSNIGHAARRLLPEAEARTLTTGLASLIDGLWLNSMVTVGSIAPDEARRIARDYIAAKLARGSLHETEVEGTGPRHAVR